MIRAGIIAVLVILPAVAQFTGLTTTRDGSVLYFASNGRFKGTQDTFQGRIYRIGPNGLELFQQRPSPGPPGPRSVGQPCEVSDYFNLRQAEVSGDGTVVALVANRRLFGGNVCIGIPSLQTTFLRPSGAFALPAAARLSRNGRYAFAYAAGAGNLPPFVPVLLDLVTGSSVRSNQPFTFSDGAFSGSDRVVADDGTVVSGFSLIRGGATQRLLTGPVSSAGAFTIDAKPTVVVYEATLKGSAFRQVRAIRVADNFDSVLVQGRGDTYAPSISADGTRTLFISTAQFGTNDPPGTAQLYIINIDGSGFQRVTDDPAGVQAATLSGDGNTAWYVSGSGRILSVDTASGQARERLGRTLSSNIPLAVVPGSLTSLSGVGFTDAPAAATPPLPTELGGVQISINGGAGSPTISQPDQNHLPITMGYTDKHRGSLSNDHHRNSHA